MLTWLKKSTAADKEDKWQEVEIQALIYYEVVQHMYETYGDTISTRLLMQAFLLNGNNDFSEQKHTNATKKSPRSDMLVTINNLMLNANGFIQPKQWFLKAETCECDINLTAKWKKKF